MFIGVSRIKKEPGGYRSRGQRLPQIPCLITIQTQTAGFVPYLAQTYCLQGVLVSLTQAPELS